MWPRDTRAKIPLSPAHSCVFICQGNKMTDKPGNAEKARRTRGAGNRIMEALHTGLQTRLEDLLAQNKSLRRRVISLEELLALTTRLGDVADLREFQDEVLRVVIDLTGVSGAAISTTGNIDDANLTVYRSREMGPTEPDDLVFDSDNPLLIAVGEAKGPLVVAELAGKAGPRSKKRSIMRRLGCETIIPLLRDTRLLGLLLLTGRPDRSPMTTLDLRLLQSVGTIVAVLLENLLLTGTQ